MGELREFYYLDSNLCQSYLKQIEDGLIQYHYEEKIEGEPKHSFEISTKALGSLLESTLGIPVPEISYSRDGKDKKIRIEEFKMQDEISQFSRLTRYLEPVLLSISGEKDREFWSNIQTNQFVKFDCSVKLSNLYLFSDFTRRLGQQSLFFTGDNSKFNEYVKHAEAIDSKKTHRIILKPDFSPDDSRYIFVSDIRKKYLEEYIELTDLNEDNFTVIGKVDKILKSSEKEIIFDLTETGILDVMRSKEIKDFLKKYNSMIKKDRKMSKLLASEQDIYVVKPAIIVRIIAMYKS